jgi:DNA-binding transcriptional MerR regulator
LVDKAPDAYRTISEVADDLDLPQHVLRFWETRFAQIRPLKRGGGRRYYRPEDIDLLKGIRHLLYGEGYTIRGVQRIIKESGVKAIQALGRGEGAASLPKPKGPEIIGADNLADDAGAPDFDASTVAASREPADGGMRAGLKALFRGERVSPVRPSPPLVLDTEPAGPPLRGDSYGERPFADFRREPVLDGASRHDALSRNSHPAEPDEDADDAAGFPEETTNFHAPVRPAASPESSRRAPETAAAPVEPRMPSQAAERAPVPASPRRLSTDDVRRLQAAIYELTECRKRLDQAIVVR